MVSASRLRLFGVVLATFVLASCGATEGRAESAVPDLQIVVTTNILGDVVSNLVGDLAEVTVIMPVGSDPHSFQASAQQVAAMTDADALIVNGAGFEENLLDTISAATTEGTPTFAAISAVSVIEFGDHSHDEDHDEDDDEDDDEDEDEDHDEQPGHTGEDEEEASNEPVESQSPDPHFFTDPVRMIKAASGIAEFLSESIPSLDSDAFDANTTAYITELETLDVEVAGILADIPSEDRVLVTNHQVFAYFSDRYEFEVAGSVIPGNSTTGSASAEDLVVLVDLIETEDVPAIFADISLPGDLSETLTSEVDRDIQIVELFSESLGDSGSDGESYIEMMRTNAERITDALT